MTIILHDLVNARGRRPSPYCWRTKLALAHKGLAFETKPTRFLEIKNIDQGQFKLVPVLEVDGQFIGDSMAIAATLDQQYPDKPELLGSGVGKAAIEFFVRWTLTQVMSLGVNIVLYDIWTMLDGEDAEYFRQTREKRIGKTLEQIHADRALSYEPLIKSVEPVRQIIKSQAFISGEQPSFMDYSLSSVFQWMRTVSPHRPFPNQDPMMAWLERCFGLYDGLMGQAPGEWR